MPVCMREELNKKLSSPQTFRDDEEVFYCEATGEIFREYEEYIDRVMLVNSTIWACALTGQENLTYMEAIKSERKARKKLTSFMEILKAPILLVAEKSNRTSQSDLTNLLYQFLKNRFFVGEIVQVKKSKRQGAITEVIKPDVKPENGVYDPATIKYKVQNLKRNTEIWTEDSSKLKRRRNEFSFDTLKYFIKDYTMYVGNYLKPKEDLYKKVIIDKNITFESIFVGTIPEFEPSKPNPNRKINSVDVKDAKQMSLESFLIKKKYGENYTEEKDQQAQKIFAEEMERLRLERIRKQQEFEKLRLEKVKKVEIEVSRILTKCDDLEREDQKMMPVYKPVKTLIPTKYFGDVLMIQEFFNSFSPHLAAYDVFKTSKVNFPLICRAFNTKEVAGPLSDMLQVLLSTIFSLQIEEEEECKVDYIESSDVSTETKKSANSAAKTHSFVKRHLAHKLYELPIDAQTLSEVLRLHLLSSGAPTDEKSERWRFQYRGGYSRFEDPGLLLRLNFPHILRALKLYTIYQLPVSDILKILKCLMDQILTYSSTTSLIEERIESAIKARMELRLLLIAENKRIQGVTAAQKKATSDYNLALLECKNDEEQKKVLEKDLEKTMESITNQNEFNKNKFNSELEKIQSILFDHMIYLGSDRAYRNYFILECMEGIFVEHPPECVDYCLSNPPKNCPELAECSHERRVLRTVISERMALADKENLAANVVIGTSENSQKPNIVENGDLTKNNGATTPLKNGITKLKPSQYELYMCTGDPNNCIVHDVKNKDRIHWSYLYKEEDFNNLINCLNNQGIRESELKNQLTSLKLLILDHIKNCPIEMLSISDEQEERQKAMDSVMNETQKKYSNSNFGMPIDSDLNDVMYSSLVEQIIQLESDITTGNLGKIDIKDLEKWRTDLETDNYDPQCSKLNYGPSEEITFEDPGRDLGDTLNVESEDSSDEGISPYDSPTLHRKVSNLASALLQIAQGIDKKFLKEPFGIKVRRKVVNEKLLDQCEVNFKQWEVSLMNSSSYSQIFLYMNILYDSIMWYKSSSRSRCIVCRKGTDAEKMLLCDECNAGTHMYCLKPKLRSVPKGNWYCKKCEVEVAKDKPETNNKKKTLKKKVFSMEDDADDSTLGDESQDSEKESIREENKKKSGTKKSKQKKVTEPIGFNDMDVTEDDDETVQSDESDANDEASDSDSDSDDENASTAMKNVCKRCSFNGADETCISCGNAFHSECTTLRRTLRNGWLCSEKCKLKEERKRPAELKEDSSDSDEPLNKKKRRLIKSTADISEDINRNNNNSRRSRRTGDSPLDSVTLYDMLDEVFKHKNSWPFLRPVSSADAPDYQEIIKRPMDFSKIKSNLNMGEYKTNEEVLQDIQLIFSNCNAYNTVGDDIYEAGVSLESYIAKRCREMNLPFTTSDMTSENQIE